MTGDGESMGNGRYVCVVIVFMFSSCSLRVYSAFLLIVFAHCFVCAFNG